MFFQAMKASFINQKAPKVNAQNIQISIDASPTKLISITRQVCLKIYHSNHIFLQNYLSKFITTSNSDLVASIQKFLNNFNALKLQDSQKLACIKVWSCDPQGLIPTLISVWASYVQYQLRFTDFVNQLLTQQLFDIVQVLIAVFNKVHPRLGSKQCQTKLRLQFLSRVSQEQLFQHIMKTFLIKLDKEKGQGGEFTHSQILQTTAQLQTFLSMSQIQNPFQKSIEIMKKFSRQYSIEKKLKLLLLAIKSIREEVTCYLIQFNKKDIQFGGDRMGPIVNFVCEKSGENIIASIYYLQAFLNHKIQEKQRLLLQVGEEASYNFTIVKAYSSIYCHVSKFQF